MVVRAADRDPKFISVQVFGRPSPKVEFKIENRVGAPVTYTLGEETHTLPIRASVTHTICEPEQLTLKNAQSAVRAFVPRPGDYFWCAREMGGAPTISLQRK